MVIKRSCDANSLGVKWYLSSILLERLREILKKFLIVSNSNDATLNLKWITLSAMIKLDDFVSHRWAIESTQLLHASPVLLKREGSVVNILQCMSNDFVKRWQSFVWSHPRVRKRSNLRYSIRSLFETSFKMQNACKASCPWNSRTKACRLTHGTIHQMIQEK